MNANKFTAGPWHVVHNSWDISTVYGKDGSVIALNPIGDLTCDEDQEVFEAAKDANAKLIAAAPELLEALRISQTLLKKIIPYKGQEDLLSEALEMIGIVIAKATGEQA